MLQRVPRRFIVPAQEVYVKNILPGPPAHGSRFNLAQANVPQRKDTKRLKQGPRRVLDLEHDRSLVRSPRNQIMIIRTSLFLSGSSAPLPNQEKTGEVSFVVFDARLEDIPRIFARGLLPRDPR